MLAGQANVQARQFIFAAGYLLEQQLWMIVDFAEMGKHQFAQLARGQFHCQLQGIAVCQMPMKGKYALLQGKRVGPGPQHGHIVIGLQNQSLATTQAIADKAGDAAGIGAVAETVQAIR